jgi:hypothetical protein
MNKIILNCHECLASTRAECICGERNAVETIQKWVRKYLARIEVECMPRFVWGAIGYAKPNEEGWAIVLKKE